MIKVEFFTKNTTSNQCKRILSLPFDKEMLYDGIWFREHKEQLANCVANPEVSGEIKVTTCEINNIARWFIAPKMPKYVDACNHYWHQYCKCLDMQEYIGNGGKVFVRIKHKQRRTK